MGSRITFLVRRLTEEGQALVAGFDALAPSQWAEPVYTGEPTWAVRDVLAHLVSAERAFGRLIRAVVAGGSGASPDFDYDAFNATEVQALSARDELLLITDLRAARAAMIELVAGLTEKDLDRRGRHPALGDVALEDFVKVVYRHAKIHLRDVTRRYSESDNLSGIHSGASW